ncbi:MAG: exopolysaccharide biosynthesis protein [Acidimicrobiales bacterium]|nr:exopolysaccharide biosynthesis protein [Acidimicrobiales bacterium]
MPGTDVKIWRSRNGPRIGDRLEEWLTSDAPTTLGSLDDAFGHNAFPVACLVLMAPSALPIPSGGATHVLDVIALVFALHIVLGRRKLRLPERWRKKELGPKSAKAMAMLVRLIRRCERISRPRLAGVMTSTAGQAVLGLLISVFIVAAFFSPPFSGLDTLPSLAVVLICLGLVFEDALFGLIGILVGAAGVGLTIGLGVQAGHLLGDLF